MKLLTIHTQLAFKSVQIRAIILNTYRDWLHR